MPHAAAAGGFTIAAFMAQFAAAASYNITYACYVSDYSRYMPEKTPARQIIASVFIGAAGSAIWLSALGAWLAVRLGATDGLAGLKLAGDNVIHGMGTLLAVLSVLALIATMGMNNYSAMLSALTAVDCFRSLRRTVRSRIVTVIAVGVGSTVIGLALSASYLGALNNILVLNLYVMAPWTAVNLIDFFVVRRGQYAITDMFSRTGIYGQWNASGLFSFAVGLAAEIPFMVLTFYAGPGAKAIGGADISFIAGIVVTGAVYYTLSRRIDIQAELATVHSSRRELERTFD